MPGRRLSLDERTEIRRGVAEGQSLRAIARALGRPVSTIAREVDRNGGRDSYRPEAAQSRANELARRPKPFKSHNG